MALFEFIVAMLFIQGITAARLKRNGDNDTDVDEKMTALADSVDALVKEAGLEIFKKATQISELIDELLAYENLKGGELLNITHQMQNLAAEYQDKADIQEEANDAETIVRMAISTGVDIITEMQENAAEYLAVIAPYSHFVNEEVGEAEEEAKKIEDEE